MNATPGVNLVATTRTMRTTCPYCGVGCGVRARVNGAHVELDGDVEHPANAGRLCSKGAALGETLGLGGRLLYATCSVNRSENEGVVAKFLSVAPNFSSEPLPRTFGGLTRGGGTTFLPALHDSDGFFVAAFRRQS